MTMTHQRFYFPALVMTLLLNAAAAQAGELTIESWRVDDKTLWETVLIPAFQKKHPGIDVRFTPTAPTEYDAAIEARLAAGDAGDLVSCRPFDPSQRLYRQGRLFRLDGKPGMQNFAPVSTAAWQTAESKATYCMPIASVMHGFLYNKIIFKRLGLQAPVTIEEFFKLLDALQRQSTVLPVAMGTAERWEANQIAFMNIGPTYWRGEQGRRALVSGGARFTDPQFLGAFAFMEKLGPYLGKGARTRSYADSQALFASGAAAVYPAGSWDIARFRQSANLELGVFPPPVQRAGDQCQVTDHMDIGLAVNRKSKNRDEAFKFLEWVGSQEFADLYTNRAIGFFSLSTHLIAVRDPLAKQMAAWRARCGTTTRLNANLPQRGEAGVEEELRQVNSQLLDGQLRAGAAAKRMQESLDRWRRPARPAAGRLQAPPPQ
jgi:raffinose/stachyose/melibiose transport system substrate-binding protein